MLTQAFFVFFFLIAIVYYWFKSCKLIVSIFIDIKVAVLKFNKIIYTNFVC